MIDSLYGGSVPLDILLESQQFTNLAAVFAQCGTSPSRYGSLLTFVMFSKPSWMFVMWGKYVALMSWYSGQVVKKCSSVSTSFLCAVAAQSVFSREPGLSVASSLNGQVVFTESVHGQKPP